MQRVIAYASLMLWMGCARSAIGPDDSQFGSSGGAAMADDAAPPDGGSDAARPEGGSGDAMAPREAGQCSELPTACEAAELLGEVDASKDTSKLTRMGSGSGWFAVDLKDGNIGASGNTRIGVKVVLSAPPDTAYQVTLVGDTKPDGGGRCVPADVTDTDRLSKTAVWGSFGPTTAGLRQLAVHVEHLSGTCEGAWTLTIEGNPCPTLAFGFGQGSMGSCK